MVVLVLLNNCLNDTDGLIIEDVNFLSKSFLVSIHLRLSCVIGGLQSLNALSAQLLELCLKVRFDTFEIRLKGLFDSFNV